MANLEKLISGKKITEQLEKALTSTHKYRVIQRTLSEWHVKGWRPLLFGGFVRDIVANAEKASPRDVDIVVNASFDILLDNLKPFITRTNSFGGLQLHIEDWTIDVWPLASTWAFINGPHLDPSIENLPKTTFLNVEAIVLELGPHATVRHVFDSGFSNAFQRRVLDINLEANPYPALAVIRSLVIADKLRFSISRSLCKYIVRGFDQMGLEAIEHAQIKHYGKRLFSSNQLIVSRDIIDKALTIHRWESESLPLTSLGLPHALQDSAY